MDKGANVKARDIFGRTPLIATTATWKGLMDCSVEIVRLLLEHGADVNAQNTIVALIAQTARQRGVSMETSTDHTAVSFHHYTGSHDDFQKAVVGTVKQRGLSSGLHRVQEGAIKSEYLDKSSYQRSLFGNRGGSGSLRQPGAFIHATQSLASRYSAALARANYAGAGANYAGRAFGQHRPEGPHLPAVRHPGTTTLPGRY